jgi:hypothetical protein
MYTVTFLETRHTGSHRVGTVEFDGQRNLTIHPKAQGAAEVLFHGVDMENPPAVIAAMKGAPRLFDGVYLRASYTNDNAIPLAD